MDDGAPIIWLTFFTLISGIVIAGSTFLYFLRKRRNRELASNALLGREGHRHKNVPDGALPELAAVLLFALGVMALLSLGYALR